MIGWNTQRLELAGLGNAILLNGALVKESKLLALKFRRALVEKSADAFAAIFRVKAFHLLLDFQVQQLSELLFVAAEQSFLHCANRNRRALRNLLRQRAHFAFELRYGHDAIHDAEPQPLRPINHFPAPKPSPPFSRTH